MLWSSSLDQQHSRYLALRSGQGLEVLEVQRTPSIILVPKFTISVPASNEVSVAFSQGDLVLSQWRRISASGDNISASPLTEISYYRLSDGLQNTARSQSLTHNSLLNAPTTSAPFYTSAWPYTPWKQGMCTGSSSINAQQGRLVAASFDRVFVAHPGEQQNYCNTNPDYYRYHLLPNGQPEMQIVRVSTNSLGQPSGIPICDVQTGFPQVASCVGTAQDTCQALSSSGSPLSIPQACSLRMEPRPVLAFEHCPTCPYWWSILDPGTLVYQGPATSAAALLAKPQFPADPIPADPAEPGSLGMPPTAIQIGAITAIRADPYGTGYVVVTEMSSPGVNLTNYGGLFFYDQHGQYQGFDTTLVSGSYVGENGAIAAIGRSAESESLYAVGSPRNRPRGAGGWNLPPEETSTRIKPEAGHVAYYNNTGGRLEFDFGAHADDLFGTSVASLGDLNADGSPDVLIGAPGGRYVSINSALPSSEGGARGAMYFFEAPFESGYGKLVASASTTSNWTTDVAIVASDQKLHVYDLSTCASGLTPGISGRADLAALLPPLLNAARIIIPDAKGKIPNVKAFSPTHPHADVLVRRMPAFLEVLTSSPILLPSNEEVRNADINRAMTALVLNLNDRDITRKQIVNLKNDLKIYNRQCRSRRGVAQTRACRKAKATKAKIAAKEIHKAEVIARISAAKAIIVNNLEEILAEVSVDP
jgi:hypothetical protein